MPKLRAFMSMIVAFWATIPVQARQNLDFRALFEPPTAQEISAVRQALSQRDRGAGSPVVERVTPLELDGAQFEAHFVRHRASFGRHCGIVLVPRGARPRSLAGFVDVPDVRWDYPPRGLSRGIYSTRILGERLARYAMILPCLRGHGLELAGVSVRSDGDRRDAYDGAADDVIAFTRAALQVAPEIDPERLAVYGASRGGGVALLAASRSQMFKAVVSFAGPIDFFTAMGRPGEDWPVSMERASRRADLPPDTRESQQLDWFVLGHEDRALSEIRARMIASSAVYFAESLPATQIHHGAQDRSVPVANAERMREALRRAEGASGQREVFIYEGIGHMLTGTPAVQRAADFLWTQVGRP